MDPRTSLVGREADADAVSELILISSPVTIVGAGGVGKTRLAIHVSTLVGPEFPDGIRFAELAHLRPNDSFLESLASQLKFGSWDALLSGLADAAALVVLDNGEHVIDHVVDAVTQMLARCPDLRILITSREPLEVDGEVVLPLAPLAPAPGVELLRERARAAGARLAGDERTDAVLSDLVARVDGLPLGIELAAIRLRSMSPADVMNGLDQSGDLLRRARPAGVERHNSLSSAIAWSYDLLEPRSAQVLRQLAVLQTPFSLARAHAVAGEEGESLIDIADILDRLVTQSMVSPRIDGDRTSYRLLETIRQFSFEQLVDSGQLGVARERYLQELLRVTHDLVERGTTDWSQEVVELAFELAPELLVGLRLCLEHDEEGERAFTLFLPGWGVIHHQHAGEFATVGRQVLERWPDSHAALWSDVAAITATALMRIGKADEAQERATAALAAPAGLVSEPVARRVRALVLQHRGQWDDALIEVNAGIDGGEAIGLDPFVAELMTLEATLYGQLGKSDEAVVKAKAARVRNGELDSSAVYPWSVIQEAYLSMDRDPDAAWNLAVGAKTELEQLDTRWIIPRHLAIMAFRRGEIAESARWLRDSLNASRSSGGEIPHTWSTLRWIGIAAVASGVADRGSVMLAATENSPHTPAPDAIEMASLGPVLEQVSLNPMPMSDDQTIALGYELLDKIEQQTSGLAGPDPQTTETSDTPLLQQHGETWRLRWKGKTVELAQSKGLADLAKLVSQADHDIHAMELMGAGLEQSGVDNSIDATARRQYEDRLRELQLELDDAEIGHDLGRTERAQAEFDQIVDALTAAFGLSGRERTTGGSSEKARSAVTWRIRAAIKKIDKHLPAMAQHLRVSVNTGTWCSYRPESPMLWVTD